MRASALLDPSFGKTSRCPPSGTNGWRPSQIAFLFQASGSESIEAPSLHFGERSQAGIIEWRLRTTCDILHKLVEESACIVAGVHQTRALWVMDGRPNGMKPDVPTTALRQKRPIRTAAWTRSESKTVLTPWPSARYRATCKAGWRNCPCQCRHRCSGISRKFGGPHFARGSVSSRRQFHK
jgi:hypothetical protein